MFTADQNSNPIVFKFVTELNRHVFTPAIKYPPEGQGTKRRLKREAAKQKANKAIPSGAKMTRQQRRREELQGYKAERSRLKQEAMRQGRPGGAAVVGR